MDAMGKSLQTVTGAVSKAGLQKDVTRSSGKSSFEKILKSRFRRRETSDPERSTVLESLNRLGERSREINNVLNRLLSGNSLNNSELLALQGVILNFNRDLTTASKLVEQIVGGIKTTLNMQV